MFGSHVTCFSFAYQCRLRSFEVSSHQLIARSNPILNAILLKGRILLWAIAFSVQMWSVIALLKREIQTLPCIWGMYFLKFWVIFSGNAPTWQNFLIFNHSFLARIDQGCLFGCELSSTLLIKAFNKPCKRQNSDNRGTASFVSPLSDFPLSLLGSKNNDLFSWKNWPMIYSSCDHCNCTLNFLVLQPASELVEF